MQQQPTHLTPRGANLKPKSQKSHSKQILKVERSEIHNHLLEEVVRQQLELLVNLDRSK